MSVFKRIAQVEDAPPWGLFNAINTAFVPLLAVIAGTLIALSLLSSSNTAAMLLAWIIGGVITIAFVFATHRTNRAALQLDAGGSRLWIVLLFSLGMAILIDVIALGVTGVFLPESELVGVDQERGSALIWLLAAVFVLIVQPIADELVYRGVFLPVARQVMGAWGGLVVTAMVYALFHALAYPHPAGGLTGAWYGLVSPLLIGLVLSGVRANSGSTRAAIIAHIGFNVFALLKLLVM
ncbi:MAG: CPBP family intramembrane metalloprotease [Anaerolineae bacterium]|nr:CPBP family intramembrane metalloprotease [Anaerolineae bacterium]